MKSLIGFTALCAVSFSLIQAVKAAGPTTMTQNGAAAVSSTATRAQYNYCTAWYRTCRYRWGYGYRFRRCMAARGCL